MCLPGIMVCFFFDINFSRYGSLIITQSCVDVLQKSINFFDLIWGHLYIIQHLDKLEYSVLNCTGLCHLHPLNHKLK